MMEYKGDFIVGITGFLMTQCSNLLFLWLIFANIPSLMGWSLNQIVFIYGFSLIPKAVDHLFFDNLWSIGYFIVRKGDFDKYLTRPVNTLFQRDDPAARYRVERSQGFARACRRILRDVHLYGNKDDNSVRSVLGKAERKRYIYVLYGQRLREVPCVDLQ